MKGFTRSLGRAPKQLQQVVKQTVVVKDLAVSVTDPGAAIAYGTAVLGDFPQGNILLLGAVAYMQFTTADADVIATFDGDYAIGTAPTADGDFGDAGEADVIASAALGAATAKLSPVVRGVSGTNAVLFDNTDGSLELNLNLLIDDASISGAADFTVDGTLHLAYIVLGDD